MTENEVIEFLKGKYPSWGCDEDEYENAITAIQALEEIQQYRAIGTVEELKSMKENGAFTGVELASLACMQMKLKDYQSIGTIEEFKALKEKNEPKKPYVGRFGVIRCSCCDEKVGQMETSVVKEDCMNFCAYCGRMVDWSE